jgi:hypothetical protein
MPLASPAGLDQGPSPSADLRLAAAVLALRPAPAPDAPGLALHIQPSPLRWPPGRQPHHERRSWRQRGPNVMKATPREAFQSKACPVSHWWHNEDIPRNLVYIKMTPKQNAIHHPPMGDGCHQFPSILDFHFVQTTIRTGSHIFFLKKNTPV